MAKDEDLEKKIDTYFSYLSTDYSFNKVISDNKYGLYARGLLLGIQSEKCRMLFIKETELKHVSLWIGTLSAPFDNPDASGVNGWFNLLVIGHFISGEPISYKEDYETMESSERLAAISKKIYLFVPEILEHFKDAKQVESWISSFKAFVKKEYKKL